MGIFSFFKKKTPPPMRVVPVIGDRGESMTYPTPMTLPLETFSDEPVEIYFHMEKEKAEFILSDLLTVLHRVDSIVQQHPRTEFKIAYMYICDDKAKICYYGLTVNTEFYVEVYRQSGQWYCSKEGMKVYSPPMPIYRHHDLLLKAIAAKTDIEKSDGEFEWSTEYLGYLPFGQYQWLEVRGKDISNGFNFRWDYKDLVELESLGLIVRVSEEKYSDDKEVAEH